MFNVNRNFAAQNLSVLTKFGVQVQVIPLHFFKAFDEDGSALDIFATWLSSDGMRVVRKRPADLARLDLWVSKLLYSFLCILD